MAGSVCNFGTCSWRVSNGGGDKEGIVFYCCGAEYIDRGFNFYRPKIVIDFPGDFCA
jgi:hypothetical protein